jgi:multiple antibiotic resistance protein
MNDAGVAFIALLAAVHPAAAATFAASPIPVRLASLAGGVAILVLVVAAAVAEPGLDALDVSPESFRVAAGIVMLVAGAQAMFAWRRHPADPLDADSAAIYPLGIPTLAGPAAVASSVNYSANESAWLAIAASAVAIATGALALRLGSRRGSATVAAFVGALLIALGVGEIVDGIKSV